MSRSDLFAYLAAFVTIVLAVALTDMIQSAHRLLRARRKVKWDPLSPLLALSVFLALLGEFFGLWWIDKRFFRLSFYGLLGFMTGPTIYTFAAFAVLPDEVPEDGLDLRQFYFDNRHYIAVLLGLAQLGDTVRAIRWAIVHNALAESSFWSAFAPVVTGTTVVLLIIYFARSWRLQLFAVIAMLVLTHFSYGAWYIEPTANV
jgi:hypothetical protein